MSNKRFLKKLQILSEAQELYIIKNIDGKLVKVKV